MTKQHNPGRKKKREGVRNNETSLWNYKAQIKKLLIPCLRVTVLQIRNFWHLIKM
jgi:hypothetical protein